MGNLQAIQYIHWKKPEDLPDTDGKPSFNPQFGFDKPRKKRVMVATEEEMKAAQLPLDKRDYCAHLLINFESCRRTYWPFPVMCKPEKHMYLNCEHEDYILRMKEYERERRLKAREARLAA
ncbi:UNVERIFIED_CONTAM: hypothetical protein PYX00_004483 [Menopon gallinae]|uniref:NADH dehydrogenase [ubiquinone] 1 beta subcomplex subunit 7 n=1 Tax=Menopon gallinae TaxID=328185 RepID=A0AAW2I5H1_9NEOP